MRLYVIFFYISRPRSHINLYIEYDINLQERRTDVVPPLSFRWVVVKPGLWAMDFGLDCGLDYGMEFGLLFLYTMANTLQVESF